MLRRNWIASFVLACLGAVAAGCGESVDFPDTAPVTGTVTLDGKPLGDADIVLKPADPGAGKTYGARARSGADGTFTVSTFFSASHDVEGAVPGKYKVSVIKTEAAASAPMSHDQAAKAIGGGPGGRDHSTNVKNLVPAKYSDPEKSGLEVEVKDGDNTLPLDLKSK